MSCEDKTTLQYDEATKGAILERDLRMSTEDNLKNYMSSVDQPFSNLRKLNINGEDRACINKDGNCQCMLGNSKGVNDGCEDADLSVQKRKLYRLMVDPGDTSAFN